MLLLHLTVPKLAILCHYNLLKLLDKNYTKTARFKERARAGDPRASFAGLVFLTLSSLAIAVLDRVH